MPPHLVTETRSMGFWFCLLTVQHLALSNGQHYGSHLNVEELGNMNVIAIWLYKHRPD